MGRRHGLQFGSKKEAKGIGLLVLCQKFRQKSSSFGTRSPENDVKPSVHLSLKGKGFALSVVSHAVIDQYKGGHRLHDRHGPREDAWVVTAPSHQFGVAAFIVYCLLRLENRGRWLEGDPEIEFFAVGDSTLDPAERFDLVLTCPSAFSNRSLCSDPFR